MWIFHSSLSAQIPFGGHVVDETGQPVSGIEIRLFQTDGASATQTFTDQEGRFSFSSLAPGAYRLVADKSGYFVVGSEFNLKASTVADVILSRKAPLEDSVTVASRPEGVELKEARPSFRETITNEQLDLLPTGNSRNFLSGLSVSSSVVKDREGKLHIRGAGSQSIQYLVDGVNVTDPVTGNLRTTISSESISSVDVVASGYAPEYGQASGGLVRVETAVIPSKWKFTATDLVPNYSPA
jgi:5-hydroxyisourate hydrolase-like protein (transthyretin family)